MFKRFKDYIMDPENDIKDRVFLLITVIAMSSLAFAFIAGFPLGESMVNQLILAGGFLFFLIVTAVSTKSGSMRRGSNLISVTLIFVLLPLVYFTGGGIDGGAPVWFIFCAIYISMISTGWIKTFLLISDALVATACYYISYRYPYLVSRHDELTKYQDSLVSLFLVGGLACMMVGFTLATYREESRRSEERGKKIDELNRAQNHFFSNMSHEIRTPINTIIGLNEMILREDVSDEVAEDARNIQAAGALLLNLINDVLDMSKIESGEMDITPARYDFGKLISDVTAIIGVQARSKGLELRVDVDPLAPSDLYGDEVRIKQILINLMTNSVKYTPEGNVTLSVQCEQKEDDMVMLICSVSDTGVGIKRESLPHLFSAFKRVDEEKNRYIEGTGLGLSIVKQLVDLMGGKISVNSVYTKGSTFIVEIPQKVVGESRIGEFNYELYNAIGHKSQYRKRFEAPDASILVVDDNAANLMVVKKLLRDVAVKIDTAANGQDALKMTLATRYDLIFMDHMMPVMDGIECKHSIENQPGGLCRDTKVIALTANSGSENINLYRKEGFDGYILKPVNGEELESELLRHLPRNLIRITDSEGGSTIEEVTYQRREYKKRTPIIVTTESVCDLSPDLLRSERISVLPYSVMAGDGVFLDEAEIDARGAMKYLYKGGKVSTKCPTREEYEDFFADRLLGANNVIHIAMGKHLYDSGYHNALEAAKTFGNIVVVDSSLISSGMGILALEAVSMVKQGLTVEEIVAELEEVKKQIHFDFMVKDMDRLNRSGQVGSVFGILVEAFRLYPVITIKNNYMKASGIYTGSWRRAVDRYMDRCFKGLKNTRKKLLYVVYVDVSREELDYIDEELKRRDIFDRIVYQRASAAVSVNAGAGALGFIFI